MSLRATAATRVWILLFAVAAGCRREPDSPLTRAAAAGELQTVEALLGAGADPDAVDGQGGCALHAAARAGHVDVIRSLVEHGADVDRPDRRSTGWTPLMHAVHEDQAAAVGMLLESGAGVDARDRSGSTALLMAAGHGQETIVRRLLAHGADPYVEAHGVNALWAAAGGGAIADITDGPPIGSCSAPTVRALRERAPDLRLPGGMKTRVLGWLARPDCRELLRALS